MWKTWRRSVSSAASPSKHWRSRYRYTYRRSGATKAASHQLTLGGIRKLAIAFSVSPDMLLFED